MTAGVAGSAPGRRPQARPQLRIGPLLKPEEHGAWSLLSEAVLLGWVLAPSAAGAAVTAAAVAALLAQQPLVLAAADQRRGRRYPRTIVAVRLAAALAAVAALGAAVATAWAGDLRWTAGLALAAPFAAWQWTLDRRLQGRAIAAQLAGTLALVTVAMMVALAGGVGLAVAALAWALLALRQVASVVAVRHQVRMRQGRPSDARGVALVAAGLLVAAAGWVAAWSQAGLAGSLLAAAPAAGLVVLAGRAAAAARCGPRPPNAIRIGLTETAFGLAFAALVGAALRSLT